MTLTTGEAMDITDPGPVYVMPTTMLVPGVARRGSHAAEWFRLISLSHVVKIEPLEVSQAA